MTANDAADDFPARSTRAGTDSRPNFLLILVDQMRADHLGAAGAAVHTPNLDALAGDGVRFERAYVNAPLCMPSRATLFTGQTPRGHGVRTNGIPLGTDRPTLSARLTAEGYRTASFGKIHLNPYERYPHTADAAVPRWEQRDAWRGGSVQSLPSPYFGFAEAEPTIGHGADVEGSYARWLRRDHPDAWERLQSGPRPSPSGAEGCGTYPLPDALHHTTWTANRTIDFLERTNDAPFFAVCSFPDPHHPYVPPEPWNRMYEGSDVPAPIVEDGEFARLHPLFRDAHAFDTWVSGRRRTTRMPEAHIREIVARTWGMISLLDREVGRVLDALERTGRRHDTVVLFASDHGDMLGDHGIVNKGPFHFESLLRIPMLWSWPHEFPSRATGALASLLDVAPTILDLSGLDPQAGLALAEAPGTPAQLPALPGVSLAPVLRGECDAVQSCVVVENDEDYLGLRLRTLITPTEKVTTYTDRDGPVPHGELFDLENDPEERINRWRDPTWRERRSELLAGLHHELVRTDPAVPRRVGHA